MNKNFTPFDEIDWNISQELKKDARMPASEIARTLGLNQRTVRNRIDRMIELGAAKPHWVFEPDAFGYGISVDIFLSIKDTNADDIYEQLLNQSRISYIAFDMNKNSLSIEARFKTLKEMEKFINVSLPEFEGVKVESFTLVPHILKSITEWTPEKSNFKCDINEDS